MPADVALGVDPTGEPRPLALDSNGNLKTVSSAAPSGTQDVNLIQVAGTAVTLGQKAMTASIPVVLPSDQASIPVSATLVAGGLVSTKTDLTPSAPTFATVGVTSAQAVAANASRKGLVLTNTSGATISLGFGSAAVLNSGITLLPNGVFVMDEFLFDTGAVNAIASAAASNLAIQEYVT